MPTASEREEKKSNSCYFRKLNLWNCYGSWDADHACLLWCSSWGLQKKVQCRQEVKICMGNPGCRAAGCKTEPLQQPQSCDKKWFGLGVHTSLGLARQKHSWKPPHSPALGKDPVSRPTIRKQNRRRSMFQWSENRGGSLEKKPGNSCLQKSILLLIKRS